VLKWEKFIITANNTVAGKINYDKELRDAFPGITIKKKVEKKQRPFRADPYHKLDGEFVMNMRSKIYEIKQKNLTLSSNNTSL